MKPGVKRSGTPGSWWHENASLRSGRQPYRLGLSVRSISYWSVTWGSASLHPGLYAFTREADFGNRMSELEEAWDIALAEAKQRARAAGRHDLGTYLDLRAKNDLLRRTAVDWLTAAITAMAGEANRRGAGIQIETQEAHSFRRGSSTMVGSQLTLRRGVRTLLLETGWPRKPVDGFVSGDGLACANIKHFGRSRANAELILTRATKGLPQWLIIEKTHAKTPLGDLHLRQHLSILLSEL